MEPGESPLDVLILRDPKESPKKCSLVPLRGTPGIEFVPYDRERTLDGAGRVLLDPAGEPITAADAGRPLLVLDSNWRRLPKLRETVTGDPVPGASRRCAPPTPARAATSRTRPKGSRPWRRSTPRCDCSVTGASITCSRTIAGRTSSSR